MRRHERDAGEAYVVIEEQSSDVRVFLFGVLLGAGIALLAAPNSGAETRDFLRRRARSARDAARQAAEGVAERVADGFTEAREELERRIELARAAVSARTQQLADAVAAGRLAALEARNDARDQLADKQTAAHRSGSQARGRTSSADAPRGRSTAGRRSDTSAGRHDPARRPSADAPGPIAEG